MGRHGQTRLIYECYDEETEILTRREINHEITQEYTEKSCGNLCNLVVNKEDGKLYKQGWKFFSDLDRDELVATLNPETKEIEWQKPTAYQTNL